LERDVYDLLLHGASISELLVDTGAHDVALVPATINLAGVEVELASASERETRLKKALEPILDRYAYILIDCPPSLGLLTVNALTAASEVLIPVQAEYYALEGLSQLTSVVARIRDSLNPRLRVTGLLVTMFDGRTKLAGEVLEEVNKHFPAQVFKTQIPRNVRLSEAPSFGKPAVLYDVRSRGAQAYVALAREVADAAESSVIRGSHVPTEREANV
jgi:chromosome partitioning protein